MRSMWKGAISFGLVTIPIKLYTATESKELRFNLLHEECHTPVQYRKWCATCDREIEASQIVKGYEYDRGRYVLMSEEDFAAIPVAAARTLEIVDFVRLDQIDPIYFEKTYFLEPGEGGSKSYALLRRAMEETGRIAIARVVIRTKESLAAIRVYQNGVLALETMHFPDEIRAVAGLTGVTEPELRPQEVEMAVNLVSSLAVEFEPGKFLNEYREALLERIGAKVAGQEIVDVEQPVQQGRVVDLMEALRASIRQAEGGAGVEGGVAKSGATAGGTAASSAAAGGVAPVGAPGVANPGTKSPKVARKDLPPVPIPGGTPRTAPYAPTGPSPGAAPAPHRVPPS